MQINSSWIKPMGLNEKELLKNPCYNVKTAAKILKKCMNKYGYTWEAIGCYNAFNPYARVKYSWKVFSELNRTDYTTSDASLSTISNSSLDFRVRDLNGEGQ
jgi:soluble lytic murein transglycosylase-like protein